MELTLWTYEGPPHVGAMRIAASMEGVHYVLHAPQGDTYADLLFTMIERRDRRPPVTYTTFQARDLGGDTAELVKRSISEAVARFQPEALLVGDFPFEIPAEFADLPRLLGRATVEIETTQGTLIAVVDGYNAPLTAGAFVDLVQKGFYNGLPFTRAEDFYVLQTGDPKGPETGYIDPKTKVERTVPLEIKVPGEAEPFYNATFEDLGQFTAQPVLPFATLGTLGWAHSDHALNDGSSQFFFFLYEAELTPAGLNLVDGRYSAFGYVVDGFDVLEELGIEDGIVKATVIEGAENLQPHA
jgi:peptidylprolyl isomerase